MAGAEEMAAFQTIFPPESFTAEQQHCYWAYDVFVRTQIEQRGLTPEEVAAYSSLYRITTLVDNGQPVSQRERQLYDTYLQVMEVYEALHSGGAVVGEPRFPWLKGSSGKRERDMSWRITKSTSHVPLPEWRDIKNVAPPLGHLRAPRHRLPPPPGWPDSEQLGYVPPEGRKLTAKQKREIKAFEAQEAEKSRARLESKKKWLAEEAEREKEREAARVEKEALEAEKRAERRAAALRRRRELAAPSSPPDSEGTPSGNGDTGVTGTASPRAEVSPEEAERIEREALRREQAERHAREKERRRRQVSFITLVDPRDGKLKEDERAKDLVNLSYQEIGEPYQLQRFKAFLPKLENVVTLILSHNMIEDLSFARFAHLERLVVVGNNFWSFQKLPTCPRLRELDISDNNIWSLKGLRRFHEIETLDCRDNPITAENDYLQRVVRASPASLTWLDDVRIDREKVLPVDYKFDETSRRKLDGGMCSVM